jgi:ketosteroid isomerase-like protein
MSNKQTVAAIYDAFSRGDVAFILAHLRNDVEWEYGPVSTDIPWLQRVRGHDGAARFFTGVVRDLHITKLAVKNILEDGRTVVVLCDIEGDMNGLHLVEEDEVHIWHFDADGRIARFRHRVDTHQLWTAYHAQPVAAAQA